MLAKLNRLENEIKKQICNYQSKGVSIDKIRVSLSTFAVLTNSEHFKVTEIPDRHLFRLFKYSIFGFELEILEML